MAKKSKKKGVPRELERAGVLCLAFANTGVSRRDDRRKDKKAPPKMALESYAELLTWCQRMNALSTADGERLRRAAVERPDAAEAVRADAVELRAAFVRIFTTMVLDKEPRPEDLATVNGHLQLRRAARSGDGFDWHWAGDEGALDRPLWILAQSAADLLISDHLGDVDQCAAKGCFQLFVSHSKRRLWCDMNTCGNRVKGRRYQKYLRGIAESRRRRQAARLRDRDRAKAAAEEKAAQAMTMSPTSQEPEERLDTSDPTDGKGSGRLRPGPHNRTVA